MKKIAILTLLLLTMTGCAPRFYNKSGITDWSEFNKNNKEYHVVYSFSEDSFFSDGSSEANSMMRYWKFSRKNHERYVPCYTE